MVGKIPLGHHVPLPRWTSVRATNPELEIPPVSVARGPQRLHLPNDRLGSSLDQITDWTQSGPNDRLDSSLNQMTD